MHSGAVQKRWRRRWHRKRRHFKEASYSVCPSSRVFLSLVHPVRRGLRSDAVLALELLYHRRQRQRKILTDDLARLWSGTNKKPLPSLCTKNGNFPRKFSSTRIVASDGVWLRGWTGVVDASDDCSWFLLIVRRGWFGREILRFFCAFRWFEIYVDIINFTLAVWIKCWVGFSTLYLLRCLDVVFKFYITNPLEDY